MYLKSLELHGFKSFPERTVLKFNKGTTIIVGPNGSGKSNMTDAMKWVLGELSSKNIRGSKMEDVIFSGAEGKKPMSFAEVSVTFDDSTDPKVLNTSYDEVTVTRRYYRSGDSEYFINKKKVRLKDINEMFMNTGIGREGYSIIGQGRIAEIVSKKSDERRGVFEESAGITKYRYRKAESERKLNETQANMERVADIEAELGQRIGPLEKEAEKARKYLELYGEKKKADVSLWLYDTEKVKKDLEQAQINYNMSAHELEIAEDNIRQAEEQSDRLYELSRTGKEEEARLYDSITAKTAEKNKIDSEILVNKNSLASNDILISSESTTIESQKSVCEKDKLRKEELEKKYKDTKTEYDTKKNESDALNEVHTELLNTIEASNKTAAELEKQKTELTNELTDFRIKLNVLNESLKSAESRKKLIGSDIQKYNLEADSLEKQCFITLASVNEINSQLDALDSATADGRKKQAEYNTKINEIRARLSSKKAEGESFGTRITALKRMQEHFDGYSGSVKYIMQNKEQIGGIHGPVSHLIKVDPEYIVAVETAFGAALQNIVTEDEASTKKAINALKSGNAGRATFYPLTTIRFGSRGRELENARRYKGFISFADELVRHDDVYDDIIKSLIGRTAVFDTLDNASAMARENGWKIKAVTMDGQQINPGGSFTGGQARQNSGVLTRNNQIEELEKGRDSVNKEADKIAVELENAEKELEALQKSMSASDIERDSIVQKKTEEQSKYTNAIERHKVICDLIGNLKKDLETLEKNYAQGTANAKTIADVIKSSEKSIEDNKKASDELAAVRKADMERSAKLDKKLSDMRVTLAELNRDLDALDASITEIAERLKADETELNNHITKKAELEADNKRLNGIITKDTETSAAIGVEITAMQDKLKDISVSSDKIEAELNVLRTKQKEYANRKELCFIAHSKNETKLNELKSKQDENAGKLWEEYELTYASAVQFAKDNNCVTADESNRNTLAAERNSLRNKIRALGNVNVDSIEEYNEVKHRYDFISSQLEDLRKSKKDLENILANIDADMRNLFTSAFEKINVYFGEVFRELFGGGHAEVILSEPDNVLESGIEIIAAPPGKSVKNLNLLSGGEQAFIAIALLFALMKVNPSPFCIFDEIEAALDEVNVTRVGRYIKKYSDEMQIIMITHRRGTMEIADTLYGVTMQQSGVSKVFTLNSDGVQE